MSTKDRERRTLALLIGGTLATIAAILLLMLVSDGKDEDRLSNAAAGTTPLAIETTAERPAGIDPSGGAANAAPSQTTSSDPTGGEVDQGSATGGSAAQDDGEGGTLTAGDRSLLGSEASDLNPSDVVGEDAEGTGLRVLSVVKGEGFFVGTGDDDRVYVEFGGSVGEDETDDLPAEGDTVDLTGPVRKAPEDPEKTLNLTGEDADLVSSQGFYVNADSVTPAS